MRLATVAQILAAHRLLVDCTTNDLPDLEITAITTDSRAVTPGSLFIAINGLNVDGHDFINQAIHNGAAAIVSEKPIRLSVPRLTVVNSRQASAILSAFWWGKPADELICIGVTGTNGKTTTSFMIDAILEEAGYNTGIIGTLVTKVGRRLTEAKLTTPDPWDLAHLLHHLVEEQAEVVTMEVSSHAIAQDRCFGLAFQIGILTNISPDHFDLHSDLNEYIRTKGDFFKLIDPAGRALANGDDPLVRQALAVGQVQNPLLFGLSAHCHIRGTDLVIGSTGTSFTLSWDALTAIGGQQLVADSVPISLKIPGRHNVYNAVAAASAALLLGIRPPIIKQALTSFTGVARRLQYIYQGDILIIDDFAHNPAGLQAAIAACAPLTSRQLILVHAIRGNRGVTINRQNAEAIIASIREEAVPVKCILTASEDVVSEQDRVSPDEKRAFFETFQQAEVPYRYYPQLREALASALAASARGDVILLLGAQGMNAVNRLLRQIIAEHPQIAIADPYDELSSEPAILAIPDYLQLTSR